MSMTVPVVPSTILPVEGSAEGFPIRRIYCVGRNYAAHAREMGHDPDREPPFFFMKPTDAYVESGSTIAYPTMTKDLHHETELVVAIGRGGRDIEEGDALSHVFGYGVGFDMTRRDIQAEAKKMGRPWDMAKGFDQSAPMSPLRTAEAIGHPDNGALRLEVNGTERQKGDLDQQIWNVPETIAYLSKLVELHPGDLIMTGTPEGVAAVVAGDTLVGTIEGVGEVRVTYR